jgi:hypothetical protein
MMILKLAYVLVGYVVDTIVNVCCSYNSFVMFFIFAPPGYGTGTEPAPAPSTGGVLQA